MRRKFYRMLFSGTLTMMVVSILLISDSVIAGVFLGEEAVAGITLVTPMYSFVAFLGSVFSLGIPILYSAALGGFQKQEADRIFGFGLLMAVIAGAAFFGLSSLFGDACLALGEPSGGVRDSASVYLFWMRFTMLLLPMQMLMEEMVYYDGNEVLSAVAGITQGVGNCATSAFLCPRYGVGGIGFASFLFTLLTIVILFLHLTAASSTLRPVLYFSPSLVVKTMRTSAIDAASYLYLSIGAGVLNRFVGVQFGSRYLVLASVVALCRELQLIFDGVGEAMSPILGIYLGEGCAPGVRRIYSMARKAAVIEGIAVMALMWACAPYIPVFFGIVDPDIAVIAVRAMQILACSSVFVSILYLVTSYDLLVRHIGLGLQVSGLRDGLIALPLMIICGKLWGIYGLVCAIAIAPMLAWAVTGCYLMLRYRDDAPLFLSEALGDEESLLIELAVEPDDIVRQRDGVGDALRQRGYDDGTVTRVMVLFEELFMLLWERNTGKRIRGECVLVLWDHMIRMIVRDTGTAICLTDPDMEVKSLRSFVIAGLVQHLSTQRQHLVAVSFNRNVFEIKCEKYGTEEK